MNQDLGLIEPRRMDGGIARPPPRSAPSEILAGIARGVTGVTVVDQKHALQATVLLPKPLQFLDIVSRIFLVHDHRLHVTGVDDQEYQDCDRPMARILKLLLLDRAGNRAADWTPFQDLTIGDFIDTHYPQALLSQAIGITVAP